MYSGDLAHKDPIMGSNNTQYIGYITYIGYKSLNKQGQVNNANSAISF